MAGSMRGDTQIATKKDRVDVTVNLIIHSRCNYSANDEHRSMGGRKGKFDHLFPARA